MCYELVQRLDFDLSKQTIDDFVEREYSITHYREMDVLKFSYIKGYERDTSQLPHGFVVHGTYGITFEPTNLVKEVAFRGNKTFRRKE